jgi:hypothetical protein
MGRTEEVRHYCRLRVHTCREKDGDGSEEFACLSRCDFRCRCGREADSCEKVEHDASVRTR